MNDDPVKLCKLYRDHGCAHVDGFLCNMQTCQMCKDYNEGIRKGAEALAREVDKELMQRFMRNE